MNREPLRDPEIRSLQVDFLNHLICSQGKDGHSATAHDRLISLCLSVRDRLITRWVHTQQTYDHAQPKHVYYLSLEFLMGRSLANSLINLGLYEQAEHDMRSLGYNLSDLEEIESDAGLGNGGLGRLAACFLDSMATLQLPAYGCGIRYEYGIFNQRIQNGSQVESPDNWLRYGNPWEIPRPEVLYPVQFYGRVVPCKDDAGNLRRNWVDTQEVMAMAYDIPVPGFGNHTVNTLRLWSAKSSREFDLELFNYGDYEEAVVDKVHSETITRVLYPNDNFFVGRKLRLKQQYFLVSATLQDAIQRHLIKNESLTTFAQKNAVQLNDTHPAVAIPELMRILLDQYQLDWDVAWEITRNTFAYTNHTVLPEALERWRVDLFEQVLPRHLELIYEINHRFLKQVREKDPEDTGRTIRMSIIEEGEEKRVRMAHLAIIGSHSVNGVAALHTQILKESVFRDFHELWPQKFNNKTNGITPRRWLRMCNPELSDLITEAIGPGWVTDLDDLQRLTPYADDSTFQEKWQQAKVISKKRLAEYVKRQNRLDIEPESLFDCQIKRLHEYKRQLLNALHVISLYNRIRSGDYTPIVPRTVLFGGKAAPGYDQAKRIIRLITGVADIVNYDPLVSKHLKVAFLANYGVSLAEKIIPAADLSEQISTAGMEASGTGNMKFALNGAITIGTLDGANVEIQEEVGEENIFIFGLTVSQIADMKRRSYNPRKIYISNSTLRHSLEMIDKGIFTPDQPDCLRPIVTSLLDEGDPYMVLADFDAYVACQESVSEAFHNPKSWARMSILNCARIGKFSSDRTIREYAEEIWDVIPVPSIPVHDE